MSKRMFIINRISNICILTVIILFIYFISTYPVELTGVLVGYNELVESAADIYVYFSDAGFFSACLLIFIAIAVKTAQFPFHFLFID